MSVHDSQKSVTNLQVKDVVFDLYKKVTKLVYDKELVPQQLNSEFRYPITNNMRDMCTNVALGLECHQVKDYKRREQFLMKAHDCTVILDTHMELLHRCRACPDALTVDILQGNYTAGRLLKVIMSDDRVKSDSALKHVKVKDTTEPLIKDDAQPKQDKPDDSLFVQDDNTKRLSMKELRQRALANSPEFAGIVNDPTDPTSPVIEKVKASQKMRSELSSCQGRGIRRNRKSSK